MIRFSRRYCLNWLSIQRASTSYRHNCRNRIPLSVHNGYHKQGNWQRRRPSGGHVQVQCISPFVELSNFIGRVLIGLLKSIGHNILCHFLYGCL